MRGVLKRVCLAVALMLLPSLALAQGTLTGTVRDASGGVLPGVTVEATSPAIQGATRTVPRPGSPPRATRRRATLFAVVVSCSCPRGFTRISSR